MDDLQSSLSKAIEQVEGIIEKSSINGVELGRMAAAMSELAAAATAALESILKAFIPFMEALPQALYTGLNLQKHWDEDLFWMVPPHVRHLAYNHPKARVRTKNWNRMWKIRERYMICHKH